MFDRIEFVFSEAMQALRRHPMHTLAAITTVSVALFLIGAFGYIYLKAETYAKSLPGQMEVRVYLKDDTSPDDTAKLGQEIEAIPGLNHSTFISKEEAWKKMRADHPEFPDDLANPLPDGYSATFHSIQETNAAVAKLEADPLVEKVLYEKDVLNFIRTGLSLLQYVGYFGLLLLIIGGTLIYNVIRLTILARRTEIRIMELVGASHATIRTPFMLEGLAQGLLGGILAAILLGLCNLAFSRYTQTIGFSLPPYPSTLMLLVLGLAGTLLGLGCSTIAIRLPMRSS